jgi:hypothetical protein
MQLLAKVDYDSLSNKDTHILFSKNGLKNTRILHRYQKIEWLLALFLILAQVIAQNNLCKESK